MDLVGVALLAHVLASWARKPAMATLAGALLAAPLRQDSLQYLHEGTSEYFFLYFF